MTSDMREPVSTLDLRTTKCPLNFVQTCLALEKLSVGDILKVIILSDGQSAINIPKSITQEGHTVCRTESGDDNIQYLWIRKEAK